ncbi:MAG: FHA domain-containing protein [Bacteriovoracaceae bacterium]|jgi:pSer/pThr/pTyr-binding forkhead associated (FHA) protein|nr:FHA domain-containing protein [Bacteriovoracaceae bacterium]
MSIIIKLIYPNKEDLIAFEIINMKITLGRNPENDISLRDNILSGNHLTIGNLAGRITIEDLGSSNGTIINSTPIVKRTRVYLQDEIVFGEGFYIALDRTKMTDKELIDNKRPHTGSQPLDIYTKEVSDINLAEKYGEVKKLKDNIDPEILLDCEELMKKTPVSYFKVLYDEEDEDQ